MPIEHLRDLEVLEAISRDQQLTQRGLAEHLGIALGLANLYMKRLVHKGFIKCINMQSNRLLYLITPRGIAEKTRLTYEFMQYSLHLYGQIRRHLRGVLGPLARSGRRIAIYGSGEAAELAYLAMRDTGLEPATVLDGNGGAQFLGMPVRDLRDRDQVAYDLIIVATLDPPDPIVRELIAAGIRPEQLITLRPTDWDALGNGGRARAAEFVERT
jgi:DNA-binding MarR family transcriptional regulator